jgi:hypothetical protein
LHRLPCTRWPEYTSRHPENLQKLILMKAKGLARLFSLAARDHSLGT